MGKLSIVLNRHVFVMVTLARPQSATEREIDEEHAMIKQNGTVAISDIQRTATEEQPWNGEREKKKKKKKKKKKTVYCGATYTTSRKYA